LTLEHCVCVGYMSPVHELLPAACYWGLRPSADRI